MCLNKGTFCVVLIVLAINVIQGQDNCPCEAFDIIESECIEFGCLGSVVKNQSVLENWPYLISLQIQVPKDDKNCFWHLCSGVLIAPELVLTGAHCINNFIDQDLPFEGALRFPTFAAQAPPCRHLGGGPRADKRTKVDYVYIHPKFDRIEATGDIAILTLNESLPGPYPKLPPKNFKINFETPIDTMGWTGINPEERTNSSENMYNMRKISYSENFYVSKEKCENALDLFDKGVKNYLNYTTMFCLYSVDANACGKDGPAIIKGVKPEEDILLGVRSWGPHGQCLEQKSFSSPLVYSRVEAFLTWIDEIVSKH